VHGVGHKKPRVIVAPFGHGLPPVTMPGPLVYLRWKRRLTGFCSGLVTLTSMLRSAARV
jgi:hypothetical protein